MLEELEKMLVQPLKDRVNASALRAREPVTLSQRDEELAQRLQDEEEGKEEESSATPSSDEDTRLV